jgi:geranylgeranyl diphosphate synthase, type II
MNDELKKFLTNQQLEIDTALDFLLPKDRRPEKLNSAIKYAVFTGGKRVRPILCQLACNAVCQQPELALYPAIAVELLHTYTLVHDDLPCMDDDDFRRGKPTVHKLYNEALAVLTGDALQTLAFEILAKTEPTKKYSTGDLVKYLAVSAGNKGVIAGQVEDIEAAGQKQTQDVIDYVHQHKTADLFMAAICLGAMAGNASDQEFGDLEQYAQHIGIAFQIADDILDSEEGDDELTCLSILSVDEAKIVAKKHIDKAKEALDMFDDKSVKFMILLADYIIERTH